jgi:thiol-disulfide isomerase/thioredoxin
MNLIFKLPVVAVAATVLVLASQSFAGQVAVKGAELGKWTMDYDAALKLADEKNLPLLLNFTGSDWCHWCKLMDETVYAKPAWGQFAAKNIVTVTVDFPKDKQLVPKEFAERNEKLKEKFAIEGYPTYIILDKDGTTELGRLGAGEDKTPESFIQEVNEVLRYRPANIEAKVAALGPDKGAQYRAALEGVRTAEKTLMDWLQSSPKRSPENDDKFKTFMDKIEAAKTKAASF